MNKTVSRKHSQAGTSGSWHHVPQSCPQITSPHSTFSVSIQTFKKKKKNRVNKENPE